MVKLVIFDLDGVLCDLKEVHFSTLNRALHFYEGFSLSYQEHLRDFDGLSSKAKLRRLVKDKRIRLSNVLSILAEKQRLTIEEIALRSKNTQMRFQLARFVDAGYHIAVASNARPETINAALEADGLAEFVEYISSNLDVVEQKPHPSMYLRCMSHFEASPEETVIIEDSRIGREAASRTGAHVVGVDGPQQVRFNRIHKYIQELKPRTVKWAGKFDLTVLIPMAGAGSAFSKAGFNLPKPMIPVLGVPMIQRVIENLNIDAQYVFIVQDDQPALVSLLGSLVPGCKIVYLSGVTEGAACSALVAAEEIDPNRHLLIANCDQLIEWDSADFLYRMIMQEATGGIVTFEATDKKWSYAKVNDEGVVQYVAEKNPISPWATAGIYYWWRAGEFFRCARNMISKDKRVNNEFYICPVYNELMPQHSKVLHYPVKKVHGLGNPSDLKTYEDLHQ